MIGIFGDIVFETSDRKILTIAGFSQDVSGRWGEHELIKGKPRSQFGGPGLRSAKFDIALRTSLGVRPREAAERMEEIVENGEHFLLIVGGRPVGRNDFYVPALTEDWERILNGGELISAKASLSLKEYR